MTAFAQALNVALLHFVWQGSLMAALLWVALFAMRNRPASCRYWTSCAALAILAALPTLTVWLLMRSTGPVAGAVGTTDANFLMAAPVAPRETITGVLAPAVSGIALAERWTLPAWSLGVLLLSVRLIWGGRQLYRMRRWVGRASTDLLALADRLAARMGVRQRVEVWISAVAESPSVLGCIRPVILLPGAALLGLTAEQLEAVLAHELAHIRRFDYAVNLGQMLIETLLFYHPAVWWVSARIRHERELCCDDIAVESCGDALRYARALTRLERLRLTTPGMAMASTGGSLLYRIQRLTGATAEYRMSPLPAVLAVCMGAGCLAFNTHWAKAHEQQPDTPTQTRQIRFEVVSIKPTEDRMLALMKAGTEPVRVDNAQATLLGVDLNTLIQWAYRIPKYRVVAPGWAANTHFNIAGKLPAGSTAAQYPEMLQAMLAERFKMVSHREERTLPVYLLVRGKGPLKVRGATESESKQPDCKISGITYTCRGVTMGEIALRLTQGYYMAAAAAEQQLSAAAGLASQWPDRPVVDHTGLAGAFNFRADFGRVGGDSRKPAALDDAETASAFNAMRSLGLALKPDKQALEIVVVDHLERTPSEN